MKKTVAVIAEQDYSYIRLGTNEDAGLTNDIADANEDDEYIIAGRCRDPNKGSKGGISLTQGEYPG